MTTPIAVLTAGVDEAGRGPLAGPVCAAAVILDPAKPIAGIRDSKQLSAEQRTALAKQIRERALSWQIAWGSVEEISRLNILGASLLAMRRAVLGLVPAPLKVLVDGNRSPDFRDLAAEVQTIVKGDAKIEAIGAASILAKAARDELMLELDQQYPGYGLAVHKGYPTRLHLERLQQLGPSPIHRTGFGPVRQLLLALPVLHANPAPQS